MGYQIREHKPYIITGKTGVEYSIPAPVNLDLDDAEAMMRFNESKDAKEKGTICRSFLLKYAPELINEQLADIEYFLIFSDYNAANTNVMGES